MKDEINEDRFSHLFDLASEDVEDSPAFLTQMEREELKTLRFLLDAIDRSWETAPSELDEIRARFLRKLSLEDPDHPWVTENTVQTLGELVQVNGSDMPPLPEDTYKLLAQDPTRVEELMDASQRTRMVGQAVRRASLPQSAIGEFMLWVNRTMSALFPLPGTAHHRYVFTRKQERKRDLD